MSTLYFDMDGTIADFDKFFKDCTGLSPEEYNTCYGQVSFWEKLNSVHGFFTRLPKTPWADSLIQYGKLLFSPFGYDFAILTALPKDDGTDVVGQKLQWMHTNYPEFDRSKIIFCIGAHNKKNAYKLGDILIDDKKSNIEEWNEAGGYGIRVHYPNAAPDVYIEMMHLADNLKQKSSR